MTECKHFDVVEYAYSSRMMRICRCCRKYEEGFHGELARLPAKLLGEDFFALKLG